MVQLETLFRATLWKPPCLCCYVSTVYISKTARNKCEAWFEFWQFSCLFEIRRPQFLHSSILLNGEWGLLWLLLWSQWLTYLLKDNHVQLTGHACNMTTSSTIPNSSIKIGCIIVSQCDSFCDVACNQFHHTIAMSPHLQKIWMESSIYFSISSKVWQFHPVKTMEFVIEYFFGIKLDKILTKTSCKRIHWKTSFKILVILSSLDLVLFN